MEKQNILFITDYFFNVGGAEKNLLDIASGLDKNKFVPIVLILQGGNAINHFANRGIIATNLNLKKIYSLKGIVKAIWLISFLKRKHISIVVTYHEASDFWGGMASALSGVPVVISSRRDMGYQLKKRHIWVYRIINRFFDRIITVSDSVKHRIIITQRANTKKIVTIYNGVRLSNATYSATRTDIRKQYNIVDNDLVIGILASLRPIKGHAFFIRSAAEVLRTYRHVTFLIVGWSEDNDYYSTLVDLVHKLGIETKVYFLGGVNDVSEILSIFDISVISSLNEGFSNAILESMACSKAVIATNSGGTPEVIQDGITGILVKPLDVSSLSSAMLALIKDREKINLLGCNGREAVSKKFTYAKMIQNMENLFCDLLKEKGIN